MAKKNKKESSNSSHQKLQAVVMKWFSQNASKPVNYKQLAAALDIKDSATKNVLLSLLPLLVAQEELEEVEKGKYRLHNKGQFVEGIIDVTSTGNAYVMIEDEADDVFIAGKDRNTAMHGDRVRVRLYPTRGKKETKREGQVVDVLERARTQFVGTLEVSPKFAFLVPDNHQIDDIFIPLEFLRKGKTGEKALVEIVEWPQGKKSAQGKVITVLGKKGENETEMHAILAEYGFPYHFPAEVEAYAEAIPFEIPADEIAERRDFRDVTTFTIDPFDAKDFDDALSIRTLENGHYEIGVHIADVSHYMPENSILDKEAYKRATSVYLVDRVVPMLPEKLSNGVCSLRPNEEKLTFSAVFEMDEKGKVYNEWFGRTVIYSDRRFTYEEAQEVIEKKEGELKEEILLLHSIAQILRNKRFEAGALGVEQKEVKFKLDKKGKPYGVYTKESKEANWLIEEFMLLANRSVAKFIGFKDTKEKVIKPFVYRIHDAPSDEKLQDLKYFVANFGYKLDINTPQKTAGSIRKLLGDIKGKPEADMIEKLIIRSMAKAVYSTENVGHYGLAFDYYTHFTSPIRRYPDVMVHRLLQRYLLNGTAVKQDIYEKKCQHSSGMEKKAAEAERASIKYKQVEYMMEFEGEVFDGIISGVTDWGVYVEVIENKCEGMIRLRSMDDDYYFFDEKNHRVVGQKNGKVYRLGDKVKIKVVRADLEKRQIDFAFMS